MKYGLPFKVGSTKECCCHVCHGYEHIKRYELLGLISNSIAKMPFEDIVYDNSTDQLPRWSDADVGQVMRVAMQHAQEADVDDVDIRALAKKIVDDAYLEVHGEIDDEKKTLTLSTDKKNPVDITKVDRLTLHHAKSGKVKYIMVHEVGKRYAEFLTRPDSVNEIVELMQQVNPQIEIVKYKL